MKALGRGVEADIADKPARGGRLVQLGRMGDLMDVAARLEGAEEVGFESLVGHGGGSVSRDAGGRLPFPKSASPAKAARVRGPLAYSGR